MLTHILSFVWANWVAGVRFCLLCCSQQQKGSFVTPTQFNYIHFEPHRYSLHCTTGRKCGQHTPNTSFSLWPSTFQRTTSSKTRNSSACLAFQISMIPVGMQERLSLTFSFKNNILAKSLPRCLNSGTCGMFWPVNEVLSQCLLRVSNTWLTPYRGHLFLKILSWFL